LTTPSPYMRSVPIDPFAFEVGDPGLIVEDQFPPISYMYHDRETKDVSMRAPEYHGVFGCYRPGCAPGTHGILKPLSVDSYYLVGFGPDMKREGSTPYAPTNGVKSPGEVIHRSDGGV
jgi:hypothetical protein